MALKRARMPRQRPREELAYLSIPIIGKYLCERLGGSGDVLAVLRGHDGGGKTSKHRSLTDIRKLREYADRSDDGSRMNKT